MPNSFHHFIIIVGYLVFLVLYEFEETCLILRFVGQYKTTIEANMIIEL